MAKQANGPERFRVFFGDLAYFIQIINVNKRNARMKLMLLILCWVSAISSGHSQFKEIDVSKIIKTQLIELRCLDSNGKISSFCSLGLDGFKVDFYRSFIDYKERKVRLTGRCEALPGMDIFEAIRTENKLINRNLIAETTDGGLYINNDGFFDIIIEVDKDESLFFHESRYYLKQFDLYKLFDR